MNVKNSLQPSSWKPVHPHLNLQPTVGRAARSQGQHHLQLRKPQLLQFDLDRCSHLNTWLWVGLSVEEMYFLKMASLSIWSLSPSSLERLVINSTLGTWHPQCSLKTVCLMSSYWFYFLWWQAIVNDIKIVVPVDANLPPEISLLKDQNVAALSTVAQIFTNIFEASKGIISTVLPEVEYLQRHYS